MGALVDPTGTTSGDGNQHRGAGQLTTRTLERRSPALLALVFVGGTLGTLARAGVSQLWFDPTFPWATLVVNLAGSLALGLLAGSLARRADDVLSNLVSVGVLGSVTTFSTFAVEVAELAKAGSPASALFYAGASVTFGVYLAAVGYGRTGP